MLPEDVRNKIIQISVIKQENDRKVRCFCGQLCDKSIVRHLKNNHPDLWKSWVNAFVELRKDGLSYYNIIRKFKIDDHFLFAAAVVEKEIQNFFENGGSESQISLKKRIKEWQPKDFSIPKGTFWTFKARGSWAVHQSDYRGNWSPYIPRTLIEVYSGCNDVVLDPFVGGGTSLVETWLTNRQGFGLDINPYAVTMTKARIQEMAEKSMDDPRIKLRGKLRPRVAIGDSRNLTELLKTFQLGEGSVKLALVHPPYLNSLRYTKNIENDLSHISDPTMFCDEIQKVAKQLFGALSDEGFCTVLIGDIRKNGELMPLGSLVMERFLKEKFKLKDIIIKAQHKDSSTRYWVTRKDKPVFLIAHEYLFVFMKSTGGSTASQKIAAKID